MPPSYTTRLPQMVVPVLGGYQVTRHDFEVSAAPATSATRKILTVGPLDGKARVCYVHRVLLVADQDDVWSRFRVVNPATSAVPEPRVWLKHKEGVPRGGSTTPPNWLIRLEPGREMWVEISAGVGLSKRVGGLLLVWHDQEESIYRGD